MSPNWLVVFVLFLVTRGCRPFLARPALRHRQLWEEIEYPQKQATKIQYYTILQSQAKPKSAPVGTVFPRAYGLEQVYIFLTFSVMLECCIYCCFLQNWTLILEKCLCMATSSTSFFKYKIWFKHMFAGPLSPGVVL